jgi:pimeloyl-ACP methyl ester carboxylesterase
MTTVFIHGVPDTAAVWARLRVRLPAGETAALALPGFGCPCPDGFTATKDAYLDWLIGALEVVPQPRDVIAHDWGSILMLRALSVRPDLFRSWVGGGAPLTADYTWHPTARLWQTEGVGEKAMERLTPELARDMLCKAGLSDADARETASRIDATMKSCILALYRSGRDVFREWGQGLSSGASVPGLVLWGERDIYAAPRYAQSLGAATGAEVVSLAGCGHWWQLERADEAAALLLAFWRRIGL